MMTPPRSPTEADREAERLEWCWARLIELSGVDGKGGTVSANYLEHQRSAASQGTRIGNLETDIQVLKEFRKVSIALATLGGGLLGALFSLLLQRLFS